MWSSCRAVAHLPFDQVPHHHRRTIFCQQFLHFRSAQGDDLWVTQLGWPFIEVLLPDTWHADQRYLREGRRLLDSTGTVYRVPTPRVDIVVKFNRVGQEVLLHYDRTNAATVTRQDVFNAEFLGPFEEFSTVLEMRTGYYGPADLHILAKWPLAIFSPAERQPLWRLGRNESGFARHAATLIKDQDFYPEEFRVTMEEDRDYLTIHHWINGIDAANLVRQGRLTPDVAASLVEQGRSDLATKGFRVVDFKASHVILRPTPSGDILRHRDGTPWYAVVDFELLERLPDYCRFIGSGGASERHTPKRRV